jgi:hypothetical protein
MHFTSDKMQLTKNRLNCFFSCDKLKLPKGGTQMKLNILKQSEFTEPEVTLKYSEETPQIENLIDTLRIFCQSIQVEKDGSNHNITLDEIFYIESVDDGVSFYAYSKNVKYLRMLNGKKVNLHVSLSNGKVYLGSPIIYGCF